MIRGFLGMVVMFSLSGCVGLGGGSSLGYRQKLESQRMQAASVVDSERPSPPSTVEERLEEGNRLAATGARARALWQFLEAHRLDPQRPEPLLRLGYFYLHEDAEKAAALFSRAIELAPDDATGHASLGIARLSQGRYEEARHALEQALAKEPDFLEAEDALGVIYVLQRDPEEARARSTRAYALDPKDARIVNNYGVTLLANQEWAKAEQAFRTAVLLDPSQRAYYNNLGLALGRQQRYDEALAAFRRHSARQAVHNNMGYVYYLNGDIDRAIEQYEIALQLPGDERLTVLRNLKTATELAAAGR